MPPYVAVVGGDTTSPEDEKLAEEVGRELARRGAHLVSGGLDGVMAASCRGAQAEGGLTIGILPSADRRHANAHVNVAIPTGMGEMRNALIVRCSDAVIAIAGEFGTLSEIALALKTGVPVVGVGTWQLGKGGRVVEAFPTAASAQEAVSLALQAAAR